MKVQPRLIVGRAERLIICKYLFLNSKQRNVLVLILFVLLLSVLFARTEPSAWTELQNH